MRFACRDSAQEIQGKLFHRIGSLLPAEKQTPTFPQLFFYDSDNELNNRLSHLNNIDPDIVSQLLRVLHANNSYIRSFKAAIEIECAKDVSIILHADKKLKPTDEHCHKYIYQPNQKWLHCCLGRATVLLFPEGTDGWQLGLKKADNCTLSVLDFYSYRLQVREDNFNIMKSHHLM